MIENVYGVVAPFVMLLIAAEVVFCVIRRNDFYSFQDSLIGLGTMYLAQCVNLAIAVLIVLSYGWIYRNYALFHPEMGWVQLVLGYIAVDFLFYWFHRAGHRVNVLWAAHVTHHSAEELNYAVGLRTSVTQRAASFLFYWPLALLGFPPEVVLALVAINLVYQLLPHTRVIGRFPKWIESWLNTPYHHRMHHALNPIYWDKNYGGTFIIWDKLFGTYVDETEHPYYGVSIHPRSWDPTYLNLHWFLVIFKDMRKTRRLRDKVLIWLKPPGFRPEGTDPFPKGENLELRPKYRTEMTKGLRNYLLLQAILTFGLMLWLIKGFPQFSVVASVLISLAIWWSVTNWAALLEKRKWALGSEVARLAGTFVLVGYLYVGRI